jgi:hypothetical protein
LGGGQAEWVAEPLAPRQPNLRRRRDLDDARRVFPVDVTECHIGAGVHLRHLSLERAVDENFLDGRGLLAHSDERRADDGDRAARHSGDEQACRLGQGVFAHGNLHGPFV